MSVCVVASKYIPGFLNFCQCTKDFSINFSQPGLHLSMKLNVDWFFFRNCYRISRSLLFAVFTVWTLNLCSIYIIIVKIQRKKIWKKCTVYAVHNASVSHRHIAIAIQFDSSSAKNSYKKNKRIENRTIFSEERCVIGLLFRDNSNCNHLITNEYATIFQRVCVYVIYID